jgi:signal transduction histidine kinase
MTENDCSRTGRIGLRSYSSGGAWRNIRATPATYSDIRRFQREARSIDAAHQIFRHATVPDEILGNQIPNQDQMSLDSGTMIVRPISSLRLLSRPESQLATVRGVVVLISPELYVQDSTGGAAIPQPKAPPLKVGDEVEVTGRPEPRDFSAALKNASVRLLWAGEPIPPLSITASQAATGAFDATFIEVEGHLLKKENGSDNSLLLDLQQGEQSFRAIIGRARSGLLFRKLKRNSLLRLRGVSVVAPEFTHNLTPFVLLLRSPDDVDVVAGPPWWSAGHLVVVTVSALVLALLVQASYSRVERWRLRAVLEERQRLAHEMHDTIAQSFAGIGFQLQAIRNDLREKNPAVHRQLDLACDLVRHSHEEARRSIASLRPESLDSIGLLPALDRCARRMVSGGSVQVNVSTSGDPRTVPIRISDTLFRIGQEAIANAVRHAFPTTLNILVTYGDDSVCLVVEDNGMGFCNPGDLLGFGLQGMRKRADSISAKFAIKSAPHCGTRVEVAVPLPPRFTVRNWPKYLWRTLHERQFYA